MTLDDNDCVSKLSWCELCSELCSAIRSIESILSRLTVSGPGNLVGCGGVASCHMGHIPLFAFLPVEGSIFGIRPLFFVVHHDSEQFSLHARGGEVQSFTGGLA